MQLNGFDFVCFFLLFNGISTILDYSTPNSSLKNISGII